MNLSNLPNVGHLANYGTRPVSSKAGALNYGMYAKKKKKNSLLSLTKSHVISDFTTISN